MGGLGLSPAFPVGASRKVMKAFKKPILLDFGVCYHGYQVDQTRIVFHWRNPSKFQSMAYNACKEIHDAVIEDVRRGRYRGSFLKDPRPRGEVGLEG